MKADEKMVKFEELNDNDKLKHLNDLFDKAKTGHIKSYKTLCQIDEFVFMKKVYKPVEFISQALFIYKNSRYYNEDNWINIIKNLSYYPHILDKILNET